MKKGFKYIFSILILVLMVTMLYACSFTDLSDSNGVNLSVGEVIQIVEESEDCTFSSSDSSIATVNNQGIVKGISSGEVTIYVKTPTSTKELSVVVNDESNYFIAIEGKQTLLVNEEVSLKASVVNSNDIYSYSYTSNDLNIATVSTDGTVKGINSGICTITVKAIGKQTIMKDIIVYVKESDDSGDVISNVINNTTYEVDGTIDLTVINNNVTSLVEKYKESIVGVSNYQYVQNYFQKTLTEYGIGTGVIFQKEKLSNGYKYYCVTNHHVISDAVKLKIYFGYDDEYVDATLINSNSSLDLAVVSFESTKDLTVVQFGKNEDVSVGDFAVAIGNAKGYEYFGSVTFGIISYCNRSLTGESAVFFQHDVAINPGNSGGPLFSLDGKVIGINTLKIVDSDVENMGFAISVDTVRDYLKTLGYTI